MAEKVNFKEKKNILYFGAAVISIIVCIIASIWFSSICGIKGVTHWHILLRTLFTIFYCLIILPAAAFVLGLVSQKKGVRITGYVFSIFAFLFWAGMFGFLTVVSYGTVKNGGIENLNIVKVSEPLPSKKRSNGSIMHYAWASDPHWGAGTRNAEATKKILKNISQGDYDAFFITGDIADFGMITSNYEETIKDIKENLGEVPFRAVPGNHDALVNSISVFKRTFMEKDCEYYYRMDNGKVHILVINLLWDNSEWSSKQEKWLVEQLESIPQEETVIVVSHCYVLSSGYYDPIAGKNWGDIPGVINAICPILEKYNVDLHISGHDHFYEFAQKDGVSYAVVGTMGGKLDEDLCYSSPYSKWVDNSHFGYMDMSIYEGKIQLNFLDEDGINLYSKIIFTK